MTQTIRRQSTLAPFEALEMYTLGINATYHDPAACLVKDGLVVAAVEDERFTHIKHGKRPIPFNTYELPFHAIDYCLKVAGIHLKDVDHIAYSFDPALLIPPHEQNQPGCEIPFYPDSGSGGAVRQSW